MVHAARATKNDRTRKRHQESAAMIREVAGDILLTDTQLIAHGVAPNDDHAAGLAHSLREYAPAMYKDFRHYCKTQHPEAGGIWVWTGADGRQIASLFTQASAYHPGESPGRASVTNVRHALKALRAYAEKEDIKSIALPRLATGAGRLEWDEVLPDIHDCLGTLSAQIIVYSTYRPGLTAEEHLLQSARAG
jgi:O-acetyl-ADP-ribose deacetylase (regulator of RNase III)